MWFDTDVPFSVLQCFRAGAIYFLCKILPLLFDYWCKHCLMNVHDLEHNLYRSLLWTLSLPFLLTTVSSARTNACVFKVCSDTHTATSPCFISTVYQFITHFAGLRQVCPPWGPPLTHFLPVAVYWWWQLWLRNQRLDPHIPSLKCFSPNMLS